MNTTTITGRATVALAEDDPSARRVLEKLLQRLGLEVVVSASNGDELVRLSSGRRCDVVLVDFEMPGSDGLTIAEEFAAQGTPVILVSGHPDLESIVVDREPIVSALSKPVLLDALARAVKLALSASRPA